MKLARKYFHPIYLDLIEMIAHRTYVCISSVSKRSGYTIQEIKEPLVKEQILKHKEKAEKDGIVHLHNHSDFPFLMELAVSQTWLVKL